MFCLHACMCATCMPAARGSQKSALDPLDMELQKAVSHHVGAGNQTQSP